MRKHPGLLLIPLVALVAAACTASDPPPAVSPLRLPALAVPDHYTLVITPNLTEATFTGEETIDVRVLQRTSRIVLHAAELTVSRVTIEAGGRTQTAQVALDTDSETAALTVEQPLAPGPARIVVSYAGILNNELRGLYLSEANNRRYAVTQLQATDARRMYPSFDEPAMKATFDLTVVIDAADRAISNGVVVSDTPGPVAGKHTVKFATTPKMSSYLLALVVGDFECESGTADGIPIRICATPDKRALTRMALGMAEDLVRHFNTYFSIAYPYGKLDVVAVPDFAAGAMENTAAIFYRESLLLADEAKVPLGTRKAIMAVLAHEIAHQWFGNLVTLDWWNDLWLNEGFATWMETKPLKVLKPEWHADLDEVRTSLEAMNIDRLKTTRPIRNPADTPAQINEVFDAIAYSKGAATLRMVEMWIGEERFRQAINTYVAKYQYANARAEDFWTTVAEATGQPVDRVMASFVTRPGVPVLSVASGCDADATTLSVTQARYREIGEKPSDVDAPWQVPVCVRGATGDGASCQVVTDASQRLAVPTCQPWIFANARATGYYRTAYDPAAFDRLRREVGSLSTSERIMLASDAWAQIRSGRQDASAFLGLVESLQSDRTSAMIDVLATGVSFIGRYLTTPVSKPRLEAWVRRVFGPRLKELGWSVRRGEPEDVAAVRAAVVGVLGAVGDDPDVNAQARRLAVRSIQQPGSVDPTLLASVVRLAARQGDAALYNQFLAAYLAAKTPDDRLRSLHALGSFRDPTLVRRAIDFTFSLDVRTQDAGILFATLLRTEGGLDQAWPLLRDRWSEVTKRVPPFFGLVGPIDALGSGCDGRLADQLRTFFEAHPPEGAERTLQQALESIGSCAALARAQTPALEQALGR